MAGIAEEKAPGEREMIVPPLPKSFEEAAQLHAAIEEELERICSSSNFRTSRKSCEFLRYVVRVTLDGRVDSLKERSIGIDLLGRDASYDPSSDATVRVRANEVRKRLASFYADREDIYSYRIFLPSGGYVPQFIPHTEDVRPTPELPFTTMVSALHRHRRNIKEEQPAFPPLNVVALMRPALIAFFLCVLLLRQQITHRENHLIFWDHLFQGKNTITLSLENTPTSSRNELENGLLPFIWLSGRYGVSPRVEENKTSSSEQSVLHVSFVSPEDLRDDSHIAFLVGEQDGQRFLLDRRTEKGVPPPKHAAILTVLPNLDGEILIQGTDGETIRKLMNSLTQEHNFPSALKDYVSRKLPAKTVMTFDANGQSTTQTYGPIS